MTTAYRLVGATVALMLATSGVALAVGRQIHDRDRVNDNCRAALQLKTRDRLKDDSCLVAAARKRVRIKKTTGTAASSRLRDRLRDGSCDTTTTV